MLQPPIYGAYLYDAVYQFAVALNTSIAQLPPAEQNRTPSGQEIFSQLRDYTYEGECWCSVFYLLRVWQVMENLESHEIWYIDLAS